MSNRITTQGKTLWQLLSDPSTAAVYQQTLQVTWQILKETGIFIWLVICLGLVGFDWLGNTAIAWGQRVRTWGNTLTSIDSDQIAPETGKALLDLGKTSVNAAIATARTQLGLPEKEVPVISRTLPAASTPAPTITPPVTPPAPVVPPAPLTSAPSLEDDDELV